MLTHQDLAGFVAAGYGQADAPAVTWDYASDVDANVRLRIKLLGSTAVVALPGSEDLADWLHDLDARPVIARGYPELNYVHGGMFSGVPEAVDIVDQVTAHADRVALTGHSLGGSRAALIGGCVAAKGMGYRVAALVTWGEPRVGFKPFVDLVGALPGARYRNASSGGETFDAVTVVPPPIGYATRRPFTDLITQVPPSLDPFALHHFPLYRQGTPATVIAGT